MLFIAIFGVSAIAMLITVGILIEEYKGGKWQQQH